MYFIITHRRLQSGRKGGTTAGEQEGGLSSCSGLLLFPSSHLILSMPNLNPDGNFSPVKHL